MTLERDNLKAGLFVVVGIVLGLVVVLTLSDLRQLVQEKQTITVSYRLSDGLQGLKEGSTVTLGDLPVGQVTRITTDEVEEADGIKRVVGQLVTLEIPKDYQLRENARIELVVPTLGSGTMLNISSVGDGPLYKGDAPIAGALAGSALTANLMRDAGIEQQQREQIQQIIANARDLTATLKQDLPEITADARAAIADLKQTLADLRVVMADVRTRSGDWFDRVDQITLSIQQASGRIDSLLEDKGPALRETIDNVKDTTARARELIIARRPTIERMLANLSLTAAQLKLASIEIRRSPWRLLYKPSDEELETDNLYDAARSFALAAGTLDTSLASLQAMQQAENVDPQQIQEMLEYLEKIFAKYQEAEDAFWTALGEQK